MLHNDGGIQTDFSFTFLSKLEIAKENWVQVTVKGEYEKRQAFIIENEVSLLPWSCQLLVVVCSAS